MISNENNLTPILVGFLPKEELQNSLIELNKSMDHSKINLSERIPHVTLWMGFVRTKQVNSLNLGLEKIFQSVSISARFGRIEEFKNQFGSVWSLGIELNRPLYLLQNRVHHFFEPFREVCDHYEGFNETTLEYVNKFPSKSLDNYDPHITIGFGDSCDDLNLGHDLILQDPKMFDMGNFCTCVRQKQ